MKPMKKNLFWIIIFLIATLILIRMFYTPNVKISLVTFEQAPLGALANIETREKTQVRITLSGKDGNDLNATFPSYSTFHEIPILGLYADFANQVKFVFETEEGKTFSKKLTIQTDPLPSIYPTIKAQRKDPDRIEQGMIFLHLGHYDNEGNFQALSSAVDEFGNVRWLYTGEIGHVMKRLSTGNLLIQDTNNTLVEIDLLGRPIRQRAQVMTSIHHDVVEMPNGNLLILSTAPSSFEDGVVEVDAQSGQVIRWWDFRTILDQERPPQPRNLNDKDWLHLNGIDYNSSDDSFIVSGRDQSAVVKVDRKTGKLQWILGNHEHWNESLQPYLLTPTQQEGFAWQWGQHAPMFDENNPNRILLYDNGNSRSYEQPLLPKDNHSRAVEYEIDATNKQISQIWEHGSIYGSELFTPFIGDANYLEGGNRLICFGGITRSLSQEPMEIFDFETMTINKMKMSARIIETTDTYPSKEVLILTIEDPDPTRYQGYRCYQAEKLLLYTSL